MDNHRRKNATADRRGQRRLGAVVALVVIALVATACGRQGPAEVTVQDAVHATSDSSPAAVISATEASDPDFLELALFMRGVPGGGGGTLEPPSECDVPEPGVLVCDHVKGGADISTLLGRVDHTGTGVQTFFVLESCEFGDGEVGFREAYEGQGTFHTTWGDELWFRNQREGCTGPEGGDSTGYVVAVGGTGRFQGASGTMSVVNPFDEVSNTVTGTLRVRADLWEGFIPSAAPLISPGAVGVVEGDDGPVVVDVPVDLSHAWGDPVTVDWETSDTGESGIATADVDYVAASGTLTFAPGDTSQMVSITVNGDTDVEPPLLYGEWGLIQFTNPSPNATLTTELDGHGVFVIVDDD